ncbi:MAG: response regulator transcription factor, partial [Desulfobulbaceae bacterium]|nr:response regulator transcription factor [Desulfobulbaceae bacterium]
MKKKRILLADDHKIITDSLKNILEPTYEVVGIVEDGHMLVREAARLLPDVIIVDISMPKLNGLEAVRQIKKEGIGSRVVFLTMHPDITYTTSALDAGALGYVLKHSAHSELLQAVEKVLLGKQFITKRIAKELENITHTRQDPIRKLSARQREVLQLLAEGKSAKEVAGLLSISPRTVEFHKYRIMEELGMSTSA